MKKRLSLFCFALAMLTVGSTVEAQFGQNFTNGINGVPGGGQVYEPGAFQPTRGDLRLGLPGRIWISSNYADRGLGYEGSYLTIGAKNRLFQDFLDGRWLGEVRLHHSLEDDGGFFFNAGVERVFSLESAGADVSLGFWVDVDDDDQAVFSNRFSQVGVSGKIKTRRWDLLGNGYFTAGTQSFSQGDPTGVNCFYQNHIVITPGIDSALEGFDTTLRIRPEALSMVNGSIDIGGYGYRSDLVDFFGGGRVGLGFQVLRGLIINAEVNYDDRFDVTGVLSAGWVFGVNARNNEYAGLQRDLEETVRNDHIVRFQQDLVLALDPDTGLPYNVIHVDNSADPGFASGTAETPFVSLAQAEAASGVGDIIFVREGNGTAFGMRNGITLKDDQLFLGDGVQHIIPIQNGQNFILCNDVDGNRPTISGSNNGNAITLANNNVVRGFIIDGNAGINQMGNGIFGDSVNGGVIEDTDISNAVLHGTHLLDTTGNWTFARNNINSNGFDGIFIENACDPASIFNFTDNNVSNNGRDGIHMENYDATTITFLRNITDNNARHGVFLDTFKNTNGTGLTLDFLAHSATGNNGEAIRIIDGDGDLRFINSTITGNGGGGLRLTDWTTTDASHQVFIGTSTGGTSTFSNNLPGTGIINELNSGTQRFVLTDTSLNNNFNGLIVRSNGVLTVLESTIIDNNSVSNNANDGMRFIVEQGSSQEVLIDQTVGNMNIANNGSNGVAFLVGDVNGGALASMNATIRNVNITGNGVTGFLFDVDDDGEGTVLFENSVVSTNGNGINMDVAASNNGALNRLIVRNLTMNNNAANGIVLNTSSGSLADLFVLDTVINSTVAITGPPFTNATRLGGSGSGILVTADGSGALAGRDNRTRVTLSGVTVTNFLADGISMTTTGDASLLADIRSSTITGNGFGNGAGGGVGQATVPFFDGVDITATGDSLVSLFLDRNNITGNFERGVDMQTAGTAAINALWLGNDISGNDLADDLNTVPIESGFSDADVTNAAGSTICLAMSNNFFNTGVGFNPVNFGAVGDFIIELDGATNGFDNSALPGTVTPGVFGTVCEPAILVEEAAFIADGFPVIPR